MFCMSDLLMHNHSQENRCLAVALQDTQVKLLWIKEAAPNLDPNDAMLAPHMREILQTLYYELHACLLSSPPSKRVPPRWLCTWSTRCCTSVSSASELSKAFWRSRRIPPGAVCTQSTCTYPTSWFRGMRDRASITTILMQSQLACTLVPTAARAESGCHALREQRHEQLM